RGPRARLRVRGRAAAVHRPGLVDDEALVRAALARLHGRRARRDAAGVRDRLLFRRGDRLEFRLNYLRRGNSNVTAGAACMEAPMVARFGWTDCSTSPSSTVAPTRYGRGGLPSTEISAAPPPSDSATTPSRAKRLERL